MFLPENTILAVIDIQGKLAQLMHKKHELFKNTSRLIQASFLLKIPVLVTEQVPEKLGSTIPEISKLLKDDQPIGKTSFSCCGQDQFMQKLAALNRKQVIVTGIEAHVCVYQTVCDLISKNFDVQVVGDAVSSRTQENKNYALERIKSCGGTITSTEMIICELLRDSTHPHFKDVINLIK